MNKEAFIAELDSRIAVLAEDERRDILDEYEQHIDIKVMRGMSEEDAIADFGRMEELVADILEAYHVRADYADPGKGKKGLWNIKEKLSHVRFVKEAGEKEADTEAQQPQSARFAQTVWGRLRDICGRIAAFCQKAGQSGRNAFQRLGRTIQEGIRTATAFCKIPFVKRGKEKAEEIMPFEGTGHGKEKGKRKMRREGGFSVTGAVRALFDACIAAVVWCLKWIWNLFWTGSGVLFGFGSCIMLFFMGVLVVLLVLGYPLGGVTIGCLGLTLCLGSVTIWCFSLIVGKKDPQGDTGRGIREGIEEKNVPIQEMEEEEKKEEEMIHA